MSWDASCPKCGGTEVEKVGFSWWGGYLGPKLLSHVKCQKCGTKYNGKTGKDNTTAIVIYNIAAFAVAVIIFGLVLNLIR